MRNFVRFLCAHPIPGSGLFLGPVLTVGAFVMDALHLFELGLPTSAWAALGSFIFFGSVIGILFKWYSETVAGGPPGSQTAQSDHVVPGPSPRGGKGAQAYASGEGSRAQAEGGEGAKHPDGSSGGHGGSGFATGHIVRVVGGDGGDIGTDDGRGGRPTRSPAEVAGMETRIWPYGRGGAGGNLPEFDRRMDVLTQIRRYYMELLPDTIPYLESGIDQVPINFINKRLEELGEQWRIELGDSGGYRLPPLIGPPQSTQ